MATIKSFTSLEQSRKLAEILPLESADMTYCAITEGMREKMTIKNWEVNVGLDIAIKENLFSYRNGYMIPCWSLASLLGVLPQSITKYIECESCQKTFHLNLFRSYYHCCSYSFGSSVSDNDGNNTLYCIGRDNWVDACVAMIEKLHELKML